MRRPRDVSSNVVKTFVTNIPLAATYLSTVVRQFPEMTFPGTGTNEQCLNAKPLPLRYPDDLGHRYHRKGKHVLILKRLLRD